jgi:hypothetical protein
MTEADSSDVDTLLPVQAGRFRLLITDPERSHCIVKAVDIRR